MFPYVALAKDKTWQPGPYDSVGCTNGALFFAPKGVRHGPHVAKTEVISLTIFDGPLTVV
jgi:hypothetical protein